MAKQGPLATCQTRIQQRRLRPGAEFCHDEVSNEDDLTQSHSAPPTRLTTPCCWSRGTSWTSSTSWRPAWARWVTGFGSLLSQTVLSDPNSKGSHPVTKISFCLDFVQRALTPSPPGGGATGAAEVKPDQGA